MVHDEHVIQQMMVFSNASHTREDITEREGCLAGADPIKWDLQCRILQPHPRGHRCKPKHAVKTYP